MGGRPWPEWANRSFSKSGFKRAWEMDNTKGTMEGQDWCLTNEVSQIKPSLQAHSDQGEHDTLLGGIVLVISGRNRRRFLFFINRFLLLMPILLILMRVRGKSQALAGLSSFDSLNQRSLPTNAGCSFVPVPPPPIKLRCCRLEKLEPPSQPRSIAFSDLASHCLTLWSLMIDPKMTACSWVIHQITLLGAQD